MTIMWLVVGFFCGTGATFAAQRLWRRASWSVARAGTDAPLPEARECAASEIETEPDGQTEWLLGPVEPDGTTSWIYAEEPDDAPPGELQIPMPSGQSEREPSTELVLIRDTAAHKSLEETVFRPATDRAPEDSDGPTRLLLTAGPPLPPATTEQAPMPIDLPPGSATAPSLAWLRGPGDFLLSKLTTVVGRGSSCDLVFDHDRVSRRHCLISNNGHDWWLEPFRTHNGTFRNGRQLEPGQPVRLRAGDVIGIGGVLEFSFILPRAARSGPGQLALRAFGHSIVGGRRNNEDRFYCDSGMVAVADGVGGRPAGALAASLAVSGMREGGPDQDLKESARRINELIRARGEQDVLAAGLATTLDVAVLREHAGGYLVSGLHVGDGTVLMQADTEPTSLVSAHSSNPIRSRQGGVLLRAVGLAATVEPDSWEVPAEPGQRFLLASDGLVNALGQRELDETLVRLRARSPRECVHNLIQLAMDADAADNVTVVVADVILSEES